MLLKANRNGVSEAMTVIILTSIAIVFTIIIALWISKLAVSTVKPTKPIIRTISLNPTNNELTLTISNMGSSKVTIIGLNLGNDTCIFSGPSDSIALMSGETMQLTIKFTDDMAIVNNEYQWQCNDAVVIMSYVQYSGYVLLDNGLELSFTATTNP